jgi:NADPH:quinone reductase-like Zn-dependent oxidoreductase
MARVVRFHQLGGPEVLRIEDIDLPAPGRGEVQIRVKALGLNRAEAMLRTGRYIETATFPCGLGFEAAGTVERIGDGVAGFAAGDAVSIVPPLSQVRWPVLGELATVPAAHVVKHPSTLSWAEAAAAWMQYFTAYGALIDIAKIRKGEFIAITAASSSVGLAAIQMARMVGAIPIAVTRTSAKRPALLQAGAAHVIAAEEEDLERSLATITGSQGVRVAFDPIGGPIVEALAGGMARGGMLIEYGALSLEPTPFPLFSVLAKSLTVRGYLVHEITGDPARLEAGKAFILDGLASGQLRPIIAKTFPFEAIVEAYRYLESNAQFGKIVVTV